MILRWNNADLSREVQPRTSVFRGDTGLDVADKTALRTTPPDVRRQFLRCSGLGLRPALRRTLVLADAPTGLRVSELLSLTWMDLDLEAQLIKVRRAYVWSRFKEPSQKSLNEAGSATPSVGRVFARLEGAHFLRQGQRLRFSERETWGTKALFRVRHKSTYDPLLSRPASQAETMSIEANPGTSANFFVSEGICYLIFTDFVSKVTVHGPLATDTSNFAVEEVGETSTMLKRYFAGFPFSVPSHCASHVFPLTVILPNSPPGPMLVTLYWV